MAIKDYLEHLLVLKNQLAENLNTMGVTSHERENLALLVPKVLLIPKTGGKKTIVFQSGSDAPAKYGDKIFTLFQEGIRDLNSHISTNDRFCHPDNVYEIAYTQEDFSWDGQIYTASIEPVTITESSFILMTYNCGCIEEGFMCLVPTSGKSEGDTIQNYIYTSLANHNCTEVSFGWLQTYGYNTMLHSTENVVPGEYYLCWLGRSKKSKSGGMSSKVGWTGLAKKFSVLMLIVVAVRIDVLLSTNYVRDTVCIAFCCNELISILENAGLMGIQLPEGLKNAIDLLQKTTGDTDKTDEKKEENDDGNSET